MVALTNPQIRALKAQAQRLKATLEIGKGGLSPEFLAALEHALKHQELVKVKFGQFKERKKELSPQLAEKSGSHLIMRVGNVVVLYRPKPVDQGQTARGEKLGTPGADLDKAPGARRH
jgi:RNA-binding protein